MNAAQTRCLQLLSPRKKRSTNLQSRSAMHSPPCVNPSSCNAQPLTSVWSNCAALRRLALVSAMLVALLTMYGCASTPVPQVQLPPLSTAAKTPCEPIQPPLTNPTIEDALGLAGGNALTVRECETRRREAVEAYESAQKILKGNIK